MLRILITGSDGQLGWELHYSCAHVGEVLACSRSQLDLCSPDTIRRTLREFLPNVIINAGAYTAVDRAESESDIAMAINGIAPGILAEEAKRLGALLVHYSTDYVFDGGARVPYREDDSVNPLSVYGRTKLAGEKAVQQVGGAFLIFRTAWIYSTRGKNFLLSILRLAKERTELQVVDDQIGSPTWCRLVAEATAEVLRQLAIETSLYNALDGKEGLYNLTCRGETSRFELAREILRLCFPEREVKITPVHTSDFRTPATRPQYSVLSTAKLEKTFGIVLPFWDGVLASVCKQIKTAADAVSTT
jgi:dTDP-4-dehydrorhamnose reductase